MKTKLKKMNKALAKIDRKAAYILFLGAALAVIVEAASILLRSFFINNGGYVERAADINALAETAPVLFVVCVMGAAAFDLTKKYVDANAR